MIRLAIFLGGVAVACVCVAAQPPRGLRLLFPKVTLAPDEQIESFTVSVACGHVEAIVGIPHDWNIDVRRAVSAVEILNASAGHGVSYIRQLDRFNGVIRISPGDSACFDVSASVNAVFDDTRQIKLSRKQLRLEP
jgi:hypothetical protein